MKFRTFWLGTTAVVGLAASANAQITNSKHDFSSYSWSGGEICKPCHTPHFGNMAAGALWNHALTNATYTMFEGGTGTAVADLDRVSRLCMSCHDGTVALDAFGGMAGGAAFIPGSAKIGTDLQDDHPIGSDGVYTTSTTSTSFNPQNASHAVVSQWGSLRLRQWFDPTGVEKYVVGCSTCHQVHNAGNYGHMLRFSNASSHLCLTCHIK